MKILVFSDSHGNSSVISDAIRKQLKHGLDMVFFLGDGISDFEAAAKLLPGPRYTAVLGNCDAYSYQPDGVYEKLIEAGGASLPARARAPAWRQSRHSVRR